MKVLANERENQIKQYQELLSEKFSTKKCKCCVVFLTLDGHPPKSESSNSDVKVIPMSWKVVSEWIEFDTNEQQGQRYFLKQFKSHLERITSMNAQETEFLINEFLQNKICKDKHRQTIHWIVQHYPKFDAYKEKFRNLVANVLDKKRDKLELTIWPKQGICTHIMVKVYDWIDAGLPITVMLFDSKSKYQVRVLIHTHLYRENVEKLSKLENYLGNHHQIEFGFNPISEWNGDWSTILKEDDGQMYVESARIDAQFYEDKFWKFVEEKLESQAKPLVGPIDEWIKSNAS